MNRLTSEDGQLYACGNGLCSEEGIECTNCHYANEAFLKLAEYENVGLQPEHIDSIIEQLLGYLDAEQAGLLIELPCKVGDTVYFITKEFDIVKGISREWSRSLQRKVIDEYIVTEIRGNKYNPLWYMASSERCVHRDFHPTEIGKTVFLTREEAEKALEEQ
jgi:hypothetical protein